MSTITATQLVHQLHRWAVPFVGHSRLDRCAHKTVAWHDHTARRYRDCSSKGTWDARGIVVHHSGGPTSWEYVWDGRLEDHIPGPLYVGIVYPDGILHLTGWRTTNNVGMCDDASMSALTAERMPYDHELRPGADDYGSANLHCYGFAYRGIAPNLAQAHTMRRVCAAVCEAHGWTAQSIAGHKEMSLRKPDPDENMAVVRRDVRALLTDGPGGDMITDDDARKIANAVAAHHLVDKYTDPDRTLTLGQFLRYTYSAVRRGNTRQLTAADLDALAPAVAQAVAAALPPEAVPDQATIEAAFRQVLGSLDES